MLFDGAAFVAVDQVTKPPADSHPDTATSHHEAVDVPQPGTHTESRDDGRRELLFVDPSVAGWQNIVTGIRPDIEVVVLDASRDALSQLADRISAGAPVDAIHIISHGSAGNLTIGGSVLNAETLPGQSVPLNAIRAGLAQDADILLYGCEIGQGENGSLFLSALAGATGADIAASVDATGAASRGGDWILERQSGSIEALAIVANGYDGLLAPPVIADAETIPRTLSEDTPAAITGITISDADASDLQTVTVSVLQGTVTLASTTGLTGISGNSTGTVSFTGSLTDVNAALNGMLYASNPDYNGSDTLTVNAVDSTAAAATTLNASLSITAVNDAPTLTPVPLTVQEGSSNIAFSALNAGLTDVDIGTGQQVISQMIVEIVSLPAHGTLTFNGFRVAAGSVFSIDQIAGLKYTHDGSNVPSTSADGFDIKVHDGGGGVSSVVTLPIVLTPRNDAPVVTNSAVQYESETKSIGLTITDRDDATSAVNVVVTALNAQGHGVFFLDANSDGVVDAGEALAVGSSFSGDQSAKVKFAHNGDEPDSFVPTISFSATDAGGGEGAGAAKTVNHAVNVTIRENDDDSVLTANTGVNVTPSSTTMITNGMLRVDDVDSPSNLLTYTVESRPTFGSLQLDIGGGVWKTLGVGATFTQADIDAGRLRYEQNTQTGVATDNFTFTVRDSALQAFPVNLREGGVRDSGTGLLAVNAFSIGITSPNVVGAVVTPPPDPGYGGTAGTSGAAGNGTQPQANSGTALVPAPGPNEGDATVVPNGVLNHAILRNDFVALPPTQVLYALTSLSVNGTLQLDVGGTWIDLGLLDRFTQDDVNNGRVRWQHDGSENFVDSIGYSVSDGGPNRLNASFSVQASPVNDAPTVAGGTLIVGEAVTGNPTSGIGRITTSILSLGDVDNAEEAAKQSGEGLPDFLWFRITDLPDDGVLQRWDGSAWVNITDTATWLPQTLLAMSADGGISGLRYVHGGGDQVANLSDSFDVQVRDDLAAPGSPVDILTGQSDPTLNADAITGRNSGSGTVAVSVIPLNDPPLVAANPGAADPSVPFDPGYGTAKTGVNEILTVTENGIGSITSGFLQTVDSDNNTVQRQYRITTNVAFGKLLLNGSTLGVGSTFTQKDIDDGKLSYKHNGTEDYADSFLFVVSDGNHSTPVSEFDIVITARNDVPTIAAPATLDAFASGITPVNIPGITLTDIDLASVNTGGGETDFIRIEVQVLDSGNALVAAAQLNYTGPDPVGGDAFLSGKGTNSLVVQGTKAQVDAVLSSLQVAFSADADAPDYKIRVTADDRLYDNTGTIKFGGTIANGGPGTTNADAAESVINAANNRVTKDIALRASNFNDSPVITNGSTYSVNEDAQLLLSGFLLSDADSFSENVTVTVNLYSDPGYTTLANAATQGKLILGAVAGLASSSGDNTNTITLTGSVANVQTALNALKVQGATDFNNGPLYLRTTVADFSHADGQKTAQVDNVVTIVPVNDRPTLTVPGDQIMSSGTNITIPAGFVIGDAKDINQGAVDYVEVTVSATLGGSPYGTVSVTAGTAVVIGNGSDTIVVKGTTAEVQAALNTMVYTPAAANVDAIVTLLTTVDDRQAGVGNGVEVGGVDGNNTISSSFTVTVSGTNDAPVLTAPPTVTVNEDSSGNAIGGISFADPDDFGTVEEVTLDLGASPKGTLTLGTVTGLTFTTGDGSNDTKMVFKGTKNAINTALASLAFTPNANINTVGGGNEQQLVITVNDQGNTGAGGPLSDTETVLITISPVNDAPTRNNGTPVTLSATSEDVPGGTGSSPPGDTVANLFGPKFVDALDSVTGGSAANALAGIAITGNAATAAQGKWQYSADGNTWTDLPVVSTGSALLLKSSDLVRFVPAANFHGTPGDLTARLIDSSGGAVVTGTTANVSNDTALSGGITRYSNSANAVVLTTTVSPLNDAPAFSGSGLIPGVTEDVVSPSGVSVGSFSGSFTYSDSTDNQGGIAGGGNTSSPLTGLAIIGNAATSGQGAWEYSLDGSTWNAVGSPSDGAAIVLDPANANHKVRFVPAADYNGTPGALTLRGADGTYAGGFGVVDISAGIGTTGPWSAGTGALSTSVTALNDAPVVAATASSPTVSENGTTLSGQAIDPVALLNPAVVVTDLDLATTASLGANVFGAGTITVSFTDGYVTGDVLFVNGALPAGVGVAGGNAGALTITLDGDTTLTEVQAILENISYKSSNDNPTLNGTDTTRAYSIVINDGNNAQGPSNSNNAGGPALAAPAITGTLTIIAVNDPPAGANDTGIAVEKGGTANASGGSNATGNVLTNDSYTDDATLSVSAVRTGAESGAGTSGTVGSGLAGAYGTLTLNADGTYSYVIDDSNPAVQALRQVTDTLSDTFTYTVRDAAGLTDTAELTITIQGANDAPVAANDTATAVEKGGVANGTGGSNGTGNVLTNDADVDANGETRAVSAVRTGTEIGAGTSGTVGSGLAGAYGTLTLNADGTYSYVIDDSNPAVQALRQVTDTLSDTFTYTVRDAAGLTDTAELTITIQGANDAPVAANDTATAVEKGGVANGTGGSNGTGNVLTNDADVDANGETRAVSAVRTGTEIGAGTSGTVGSGLAGAYGTLTLNADGTYSYVIDDSNSTVQALKVGQSLSDTFTYTVRDAAGLTDTAELTITIQGANDAPVANPDTNFVVDGGPNPTGNVLTTTPHTGAYSDQADVDLEGDALAVSQVNGSAVNVGIPVTVTYGTLTLNADGTYSYVLDSSNPAVVALIPGATLTETINYQVSDGQGGTAAATLTVTIFGKNNDPEGADNILTTDEDTPLVINVADFGFTDADSTSPANDFVAVRIDALPATGTLLLNGVPVTAGQIVTTSDIASGKLRYESPLNISGAALDTFTFSVQDGLGGFDQAPNTMTINVNPVSDAPLITTVNADVSNEPEGRPIPLNITVSITDGNGPAPETLGLVTISGIPAGSTLTNTAGDTLVITGDSISLTPAQLTGLMLTPPSTQQADFVLRVTAGSTDGAAAPAFSVADLKVKLPAPPPQNVAVSPPLSEASERGSGSGIFDRRSSFTTDPPGVWDGGLNMNRVINLPIPLHPIVFVEVTVQREQIERGRDDLRLLGVNFDGLLPPELQSGSIGSGLGMDPVLYVKHAVDTAERERLLLQGRTVGREGRISLSTDGILPHQGIFAPVPGAPLGNLVPFDLSLQKQDGQNGQKSQQVSQFREAVEVADGFAVERTGRLVTDGLQKQEISGASSFTEQLRRAAQRVIPVDAASVSRTQASRDAVRI